MHLAIVATATSARPAVDSRWTRRAIADHLAGTGISASQVGRVLAGLDLEPHLVRGWLVRPEDPGFYAKAAEVYAPYLRRPPGSVVLGVDDSTIHLILDNGSSAEASSAPARTSSSRSANSPPPTTTGRDHSAGPTTAPRSRQPDPRRISAAKC